MDPDSLNTESRSFRTRGKEILRLPFRGFKASRGENNNDSNAIDHNGPSSSGKSSGGISPGNSLAERAHEPEFLTKLPDPKWIDIEMMGYWLQKCDKEHGSRCFRPFGLDMLELGQANLLIDVKRKCLAVAKPEYRYACLSYVWGGANTLKASKDNLDRLMEENSLISQWDEIPKTIRNAIDLVEQLGLSYIWVDSLCILQDDVVSKHDQIQAMAGIYANAYVTIIAGNGWDADHGLRGIQGVTEPRQLSSFLKNDFTENLQPFSSIWYSRGWTFQEMIFSPRKIMFQYQLAIWECNTSSWHESSLSRVPSALHASSYQPSISPWQHEVRFSRWPNIRQYINLGNDYCKRKLTYDDDALPAITSLLSVMSYSFPGGFISGLPQMFFDEALLWQPKEPMQRRKPSSNTNTVPSWSWAGWEGEIVTHEWERHWSHLQLNRLDRSTFRQNLCGDPIFQVVPMVEWYYGDKIGQWSLLTRTGRTYVDHLANPALPLPSNWSRHSLSFSHGTLPVYYHDNEPGRWSLYPLPTSHGRFLRPISARYLFCRTSRGYFKSSVKHTLGYPVDGGIGYNVTLEDRNNNAIGHLHFSLGLSIKPLDRTAFELVVISAGSLTSQNITMVSEGARLPPGIGWGSFSDSASSSLLAPGGNTGVGVVEFYYVLWIGWENGVAHRKGLGRVLKKAWDREKTDEIDLILG